MKPADTDGDPTPSLSAYQAAFHRFVERHPECRKRATFEHLPETKTPSNLVWLLNQDIPVQPWPLFLDPTTYAGFAEVARTSFNLVRSLPQRVFDNDAVRICEFYGLDPDGAGSLQRILDLPWGVRRDVMRGDYLLCDGVLKCIELNATTKTGGFFCGQGASALLSEPMLHRFFAEESVDVRFRDPWRNLLRLLIERALERNLHQGGLLNIGFLIRWADEYLPATPILDPPYQELLAKYAPGTEGKIIYCHDEHLERDGDVLKARGEAVQIVIQIKPAVLTDPPEIEVEAWLDGIIDLYPGPLNWVYSDKRNLGFLSAHADTPGRFTDDEAGWIDQHIPWTRIVQPGSTTRHGERAPLETMLLRDRESLVLKPAQSFGGAGVKVGCRTSVEEWEDAVGSALKYAGTYSVQEYLQDDLQLQQWGDEGTALCSVNWGIFVADQNFGGMYLRLSPLPEDGVVNLTNGAVDGCVFELSPAGTADGDADLDTVRTFHDSTANNG